MTTSVTIAAHCNPTTEVSIVVRDKQGESAEVIQDGEVREISVYDERVILVEEIPKSAKVENPED